MRRRRQLERQLRDVAPRSQAPGDRQRREDWHREGAIGAVARVERAPQRAAVDAAGDVGQPRFGLPRRAIDGWRCGRDVERSPGERGGRDVRAAVRRVAPAAVGVGVGGEPRRAAIDELPDDSGVKGDSGVVRVCDDSGVVSGGRHRVCHDSGVVSGRRREGDHRGGGRQRARRQPSFPVTVVGPRPQQRRTGGGLPVDRRSCAGIRAATIRHGHDLHDDVTDSGVRARAGHSTCTRSRGCRLPSGRRSRPGSSTANR